MASNLVWISRILRARAVCWFRETEAGIVNGAGGAKDFVESSALWKTSEDNGRCMVMGTLLQLVTVYVVEDNIVFDVHCSNQVSNEHDLIYRSVYSQRIPLRRRQLRMPDSYFGIHSIDQLFTEPRRAGKLLHNLKWLVRRSAREGERTMTDGPANIIQIRYR